MVRRETYSLTQYILLLCTCTRHAHACTSYTLQDIGAAMYERQLGGSWPVSGDGILIRLHPTFSTHPYFPWQATSRLFRENSPEH